MSKTTLFKRHRGMPKPVISSLNVNYLALINCWQGLTLPILGKQNYFEIGNHSQYKVTPLFSKTNKQNPNKIAATPPIKRKAHQKNTAKSSKLEQSQIDSRLHSNRKWLGLVFATWFIIAIAFLISVIYTS